MTKKLTTTTFILHITMAVVLLSHRIPGMFDGGVNAFCTLLLSTDSKRYPMILKGNNSM